MDKSSPYRSPKFSEFPHVTWTPPIDHFFDFISSYRKITNTQLGGTRVSTHIYPDITLSTVMSVGPNDLHISLPFRISLSNFKIGCPILSYGCILRHSSNPPEYLLIKHTHSVNFIDLIRGNYRHSSLFFMIQELPDIERHKLLSLDYDSLWFDLHQKSPDGHSYQFGKHKFTKLSPLLPQLFNLIQSIDPLGKFVWGFPKGRPDYQLIDSKTSIESPFSCAVREFSEETNQYPLTISDLIFPNPVTERFLGTNSKNYQTDYFIFNSPTKFPITPFTSVTEIESLAWVPYPDCPQFLRPERFTLLSLIESNFHSSTPSTPHLFWTTYSDSSEYSFD